MVALHFCLWSFMIQFYRQTWASTAPARVGNTLAVAQTLTYLRLVQLPSGEYLLLERFYHLYVCEVGHLWKAASSWRHLILLETSCSWSLRLSPTAIQTPFCSQWYLLLHLWCRSRRLDECGIVQLGDDSSSLTLIYDSAIQALEVHFYLCLNYTYLSYPKNALN